MSELKFNDTIISDTMDKIHETEKGFDCCGKEATLLCHADGFDFYSYIYQCECDNKITITYKRKDDLCW